MQTRNAQTTERRQATHWGHDPWKATARQNQEVLLGIARAGGSLPRWGWEFLSAAGMVTFTQSDLEGGRAEERRAEWRRERVAEHRRLCREAGVSPLVLEDR